MDTSIRLAIAEDHEMVRKATIGLINDFGGFTVEIEAADGKELFDKLSDAVTLPDVVIMDISMPGWDGYKTIDSLKKKWPDLKVLVLSMHTHEMAMIKMLRSGVSGYLFKNSSPRELEEALRSIVTGRLYFSGLASSAVQHWMRDPDFFGVLTEKEILVLKLCHTDLTYKEMSIKLGISERTVTTMRDSLFEKLKVNSRVALAVCGMQMGIIPLD